ncbi:hypothetical protein [Variovorax sp. GT1P44]|uniref:hypothetical protein n=1 Tax=Variovorax sp. GT1P44 TaxID=3443742 RepID=UPI003F47FA5D
MGIETALIGAGLSASTAAAASAAITAVGTAALGAAASKALAPKQPTSTTQVTPLTQADKPQAAKDVDLNAIKNKNAMAAAAAGQLSGNNSTLLTGSSGVNSGSLNLGTSTLLGQ